MPFKSIRWKLTAWYVVLLGIILILFSVFLYLYLSKRLFESVDRSLRISAAVVAKSAMMRYSLSPMPGMESLVEQDLGFEDLNKFYRIYDGSGNVGSRSKNIDLSQFPLSKEAYAHALNGGSTFETFYVGGEHPIRVLTKPILHNKKLVNLVQVGTSLEAVEATLTTLRISLLAAVPLVLTLATLVGWFLARRSLKPVAQITRTAREISSGADLTKRIAVPEIHDEIGQLAATFNDMMARLENSFTQMRQFSSDASHELRTPLTVLKGQSELILSKERDPSEYQEVLSSNLEEINYMSKVLEDLFRLSRSDEEETQLDLKAVDLGGLIEEVCKHAQVLADEKHIQIIIDCLEPVQIMGDNLRLRQMTWNLLHNAIKYTLRGGTVKIALQDHPGHAFLTIEDTGIGIPKEHLPHIFNRFYRVDKARSRKEGGSGLGLSICRHIVEAHKGQVEVESQVNQGTKVKIRLPKTESMKPQPA